MRKLATFLEKADTPLSIHIECLLSEFHSRMEGMNDDEHADLTRNSTLVVGFLPPNDISQLLTCSEQFKTFLTTSELSSKFALGPMEFHTGINWYPREDEYDEESDDETDDETDDESDDETDDPTPPRATPLTAEELRTMFYS